MLRIGVKLIIILVGVEVIIVEGNLVIVKGLKGILIK